MVAGVQAAAAGTAVLTPPEVGGISWQEAPYRSSVRLVLEQLLVPPLMLYAFNLL